MENCPFCGAPGAYREAVDGCCYVCGMVLPTSLAASAEDEPAGDTASVSPAPKDAAPTIVMEPKSPPTLPGASDESDETPAIQLIAPRKLSPQYAHHVTAAWQATGSPFDNPRETLNSSSIKTKDPEHLLIGTRSLSSVDEKRRADYELSEVIGEGNMGTVWAARQSSLDREVAVKIPKKTASGSTLGREQFISEVVVTGQLDHPNIVPIYDLARDQSGQLFYAMKRVEGRPWNESMHAPGRTRQENLEILMKVCDAIRFAHDRGVIHRDIKPQNIMVGKYGEVSVMDWGIALRLDSLSPISAVTKLSPAGTPAYMAPEMATANPGEIGPHTDVYLLGAVLYEIITGQPPHPPPADSHDRLVQQNACLLIAARNVITPAKETGELIDIAYKALATDIDKRYRTVEEFQNALRQYLSHAESIALADRGHEHLANAAAMRNGAYEDYAKARFAFEEAIQLWPQNTRARSGLAETTLAYAQTALQRGDYALGLSLLDSSNAEHAELLKKLTIAKRRSERTRFVARASAVVAAASLLLAFVISLYFLDKTRKANQATQAALDQLEQKSGALEVVERKLNEADQSLTRADLELKSRQTQLEGLSVQLAATNEQFAKTKDELTQAQQDVKRAEALVDETRTKAEQAAYRSDLRLADEYIDQNAFDNAREILSKYRESPLRDWEWERLNHLAEHPAASRFRIDGAPRIESVAVSADQKWMVAGAADNNVYVWRRDDAAKPARVLAHAAPVSAVAMANDSNTLAVAAGNEVHFWNLATGENVGSPLIYDHAILSVAFHPQQSDTVLTSARDSTVQVWSRNKPGSPELRYGHLSGAVWQARFSPDGSRIVSAGEDGSVRIWHPGSKNGRLLGAHRGPVYAVEFTPDGQYVVSGGRDRRLLAWKVPVESEQTGALIVQRLQGELDVAEQDIHPLGEHAAEIHGISITSDGKTAFSASNDNTVKVWDVSQGVLQGKLLKTLRGHGGWVRSCAALADGHRVISGSHDGSLFDWDWQRYDFPQVLRPGSENSLSELRFTSAASSPDGKWLATAAENGAITIWDLRDPLNPLSQLLTEGHDWLTTTAVYFDDGKRLLTAAGDNSTVVWDAQRGNQLLRIGSWNTSGGTGWRGVAAVSHHGRWIATGSDGRAVVARLWDAHSGNLVAALRIGQTLNEVEPPEATSLAFSHDDGTLLVGDQWGRLHLFETSRGSLLRSFQAHGGKITETAFLPDSRIVSAGADGTVSIWSTKGANTRTDLRPEGETGRIVAIQVSGGSRNDDLTVVMVVYVHDGKAVLHRWNAVSGEPIGAPEEITKGDIRAVSFHPSQPKVLITEFDPNTLRYQVGQWSFDGQDVAYQTLLKGLGDTSLALFAPSADNAILTVGGRGARLFSVGGQNLMERSFRPQTSVMSVSFAPDSRLIAAAGRDGSAGVVKLWRYDEPSGQWRSDRSLTREHRASVNCVSFHPSRNDMLVTASDDGTAKIWTYGDDDWRVTATLGGGNEPNRSAINQAIFSPDHQSAGVQVLTASDGRGIEIWSLAGQRLGEVASSERIQAIAVSSDRKWIVFAVGSDIRVWNWQTQRMAAQLVGHSADVTSLAFSPAGTRLFSAGRDFLVKVWDVSPWATASTETSQQRELMTFDRYHTAAVRSVSLYGDPSHPSLLTAGEDGQAILWLTGGNSK